MKRTSNPSDASGPSRPAFRENMEKVQNQVQREKEASFRQHERDLHRLDSVPEEKGGHGR